MSVRRRAVRLLRRTASGRQLEFLLRRWRAGQRRRGQIPDECRPSMPSPPYPPYHTGPPLEEYFFAYARDRRFAREYIPVFWTAAYIRGQAGAIQPALLSLSPHRRYFTVCQHDLAPQEILPPDTLVFSAGGLYRGPGHVPIPLVCSRLRDPIETKSKDVFCSFVGTLTHPMRREIWQTHREDPAFRFAVFDRWTIDVPPARFELFTQLTERSRFTLCPRGFGATSFPDHFDLLAEPAGVPVEGLAEPAVDAVGVLVPEELHVAAQGELVAQEDPGPPTTWRARDLSFECRNPGAKPRPSPPTRPGPRWSVTGALAGAAVSPVLSGEAAGVTSGVHPSPVRER